MTLERPQQLQLERMAKRGDPRAIRKLEELAQPARAVARNDAITGFKAPRATRAVVQTEAALQNQIVKALRERGYVVWEMFKGSTKGGSVWATKGIPDLYIPGWGWIELKSESGVISLEQYARHSELRAKFQRLIVATSLEEAIREVTESSK